jgi:single-stranded-DNA-specific exonuclease
LRKKFHIKTYDEKQVAEIADNYHLNQITAITMYNRNLKTNDSINEFLNTEFQQLKNPFDIKFMEDAVKLLGKHAAENNKIFVYGDYDADGVTATAQLVLLLKAIEAKFGYHLPDREADGYGLNMKTVDDIIEGGYKLLITLDCGISNYDEIERAIEAGIDVIVIDHHKCPEKLPPANVLIDPHIDDTQVYYQVMCGAGLAYKFVCAYDEFNNLGLELNKFIQLAAIGTVADIVAIKGENRIIVKNGLFEINNNTLLGIKCLLNELSINNKEVTSSTLGYIIGPRINAAGRVDDASLALEMLVSEDKLFADKMAAKINGLNSYRKEIEKKIFLQADIGIHSQKASNFLVSKGGEWHEGVIGIVSSRITEKYFKPSIVFSKNGEFYKGSGRSIPTFNLYEAVKKFEHLTVKCGGHSQAIGLTVHKDNIADFIENIKKYANEKISDMDLVKEIDIDAVIMANDKINLDTVNEIYLLEPFGLENEQPVFLIDGYELVSHKFIGAEGNHLKASIKIGKNVFDVIKFNIDENEKKEFQSLNPAIGNLNINTFNGRSSVQFNIITFTGNYFENIKLNFLKKIPFMNIDFDTSEILEGIFITEEDLQSLDSGKLGKKTISKVGFAKKHWIPTIDEEKIISIVLNKNNSSVFKFDINKLVNYINKLYNIVINEEKIISTIIGLNNKGLIDFKLKSNIVYVKYLNQGEKNEL